MKRWLRRLPIRAKVMLLAGVVTTVALLISGSVLVYFAYSGGRDALRYRLHTQAQIAALSSAAALAFEDPQAAEQAIEVLAGDAAIVAAEVRRADGSRLTRHIFRGLAAPINRKPQQNIIHVSADVTVNEKIGSVHVWATDKELHTLLQKQFGILLAATIAALAVALLAASRLQRIISGPIVSLADTAAEVSKSRDYSLRGTATSEDEVGQLVGAFNGMLAQMQAQESELLANQTELERKVESRTSQLAAALKDAQAAARAKADFLANMSHEIRTPMNGVIGMLDLMDGEGLDPQRRGMLETARNSAESLLGIINDVLDFSKIDAGKLTFESIDVELRPLAEEVATLFARQANGNGVEVTCLVDTNAPAVVRSDPTRLRQIIANLLGNAVKFTEQGEVSLSLRMLSVVGDDAVIEISIRDTGIGMAQQTVDNLFQSFTQADTSTTRRFGGTGLGLAITKRLVDAMNGTISVTSELGKGSVFTVTLPVTVRTGVAGAKRADLSKLKALIVDDNATNRRVLEHYLDACRTAYHSVASAQEGLLAARAAAARGEPFDLVLLDHQMPDLDGLYFLQQLRADPAIASLTCLVLSSLGERLPHGESYGVAAWLTKPIRQMHLYSAVATAMGVSVTPDAVVQLAGPAQPAPQRVKFEARVLLVEDNEVNQLVASRLLANFGIAPHIAVNGSDGVQRIRSGEYDLVLMDCQMPVMDGYEATRTTRAWEAAEGRPRLPIIAMTANAMQGDRERCLAAGMDDYLTKPVKRDALAEMLQRWLQPVPAAAVTPDAPATDAVVVRTGEK
jgi:signal transduction histidine kinase/DNA-binding response OmpR family regulator